jgi:hypothetical protein
MPVPRRGRPYRTAVALMWARWQEAGNGTMCHICGHQGATEADHLDPIADSPNQVPHWTRIRPAHGVNPRGQHDGLCRHPDCHAIDNRPRACNQTRGAKPLTADTRPAVPKTTRKW